MTQPAITDARQVGVAVSALTGLDAACFAPGDVWAAQSWQGELDADDRVVLVQETSAGDLVGAATFQVVGDTADLHRVMVHPGQRGRRLAQQLLQQGMDRCRRLGAERVLLEVESDNEPALALYRRNGFVPLSRRRDYYGPGRHAVVMQRDLADAGAATVCPATASGDAGGRGDEVVQPLAAPEGGRS